MNTDQRVLLYQKTKYALDVIGKWDRGEKVSRSTAITLEKVSEELGLTQYRKCLQAKKLAEVGS